jgi:hypothetical protein
LPDSTSLIGQSGPLSALGRKCEVSLGRQIGLSSPRCQTDPLFPQCQTGLLCLNDPSSLQCQIALLCLNDPSSQQCQTGLSSPMCRSGLTCPRWIGRTSPNVRTSRTNPSVLINLTARTNLRVRRFGA